jgi:hypothetical protein
MIFFVNSTTTDYICDVRMSDFPCKFFIYTKGYEITVRMTRFKHTDKYLNDIDDDLTIPPVYKDLDEDTDENTDVDTNYTDYPPRIVKHGTKLL